MPISSDILLEIKKLASDKNFSEQVALDFVRRKYLLKISDRLKMPVIIYAANFSSPRSSIDLSDIHAFMGMLKDLPKKSSDKTARVCLFLHSPGGSFDATDELVQYLMSRFNAMEVIVPLHAFSCATLVTCAAQKIYMGQHSCLGPIDPQMPFTRSDGQFSFYPAYSIISQFEDAKRDCMLNPRQVLAWQPILQQYAPCLVKQCEVAIERSRNMATEWLNKYQGIERKKAAKIAYWLVNQKNHNSHGKPLCFEELKNKGLKVVALEEDQDFQDDVLSLFHAIMFSLNGRSKLIENSIGRIHIF